MRTMNSSALSMTLTCSVTVLQVCAAPTPGDEAALTEPLPAG